MTMDEINLNPPTIGEAHASIEQLLRKVVQTQDIAIDLGNRLIVLNNEKLRSLSH